MGFLKTQIAAIRKYDPAARSVLEILLCYPGLHSLALHRLASCLWRRKLLLAARFVSHINRFLTGIEIHPGASVHPSCFIDHGMGIVIGETARVGPGTRIYHGVTLGGTGTKRGKRHPTVGANVLLGARATVLGPVTLGDGAQIGAGAVVLNDVAPGQTVVGVKAVPVKNGRWLPRTELTELTNRLEKLETRLAKGNRQ